jgi:hypothetical protein
MDKGVSSPPRCREPTSAEHTHEDPPPSESRPSGDGNAPPTLTGEPEITNPLEVGSSSNEVDGEVRICFVRLCT